MSYTKKFRNRGRYKFLNTENLYQSTLQNKNIQGLEQYCTIEFADLRRDAAINRIRHIWKTGDRYYKLASKFYGKPELWWVIAMFNQRPTEGHLRKGDVIEIPVPITAVMSYL